MCKKEILSRVLTYCIIQEQKPAKIIKSTSSSTQTELNQVKLVCSSTQTVSSQVKLTCLSTQTESSQIVDISFELCEKRLFEILNFTIQQDSPNSNSILNNIELELGEVKWQSKFVFIRALVTAVCRCCLYETSGIYY